MLDAANLFETASPAEQRDIVTRAVDLLADRIVMAHAKDRAADGAFVAAGRGVLDYRHYIAALRGAGFDGPLVTHGLSTADAPDVAAFLRRMMAEARMSSGTFDRQGVSLRYEDVGEGPAVLFQHGLGGDAAQVAEVFPEAPATGGSRSNAARMADPRRGRSPICRSPRSPTMSPPSPTTSACRAVVGGISMGAAISLRLAVTRPDLVRALVLARPAWMFAPAPDNMQPIALRRRSSA